MTQCYLSGELSVLLARLQTVTLDGESAAVADLRCEAESMPVRTLGSVVARALRLADILCWNSLSHGDSVLFNGQTVIGAEPRAFGECVGLIPQR